MAQNFRQIAAAAPDHFQGDVKHEQNADIRQVWVPLQQSGNVSRSNPHECNRQHKPGDKHRQVLVRCPGNSERIVNGHGDICDGDLRDRTAEAYGVDAIDTPNSEPFAR